MWSFDGSCLKKFTGHNSFIYSLAVTIEGNFLSSSEDRTVKIWKSKKILFYHV